MELQVPTQWSQTRSCGRQHGRSCHPGYSGSYAPRPQSRSSADSLSLHYHRSCDRWGRSAVIQGSSWYSSTHRPAEYLRWGLWGWFCDSFCGNAHMKFFWGCYVKCLVLRTKNLKFLRICTARSCDTTIFVSFSHCDTIFSHCMFLSSKY